MQLPPCLKFSAMAGRINRCGSPCGVMPAVPLYESVGSAEITVAPSHL